MMLPTPAGVVCAVAAAPQTPEEVIAAALPSLTPRSAYVEVEGDDPIVRSCDALIAVIDGDVGLHPDIAAAWHAAQEHSLPRLAIAVRTADGRANFDEVTAVVRRALEPDIAVRYLPLYDDDGVRYAGVLDVLRSTVTVGADTHPADPEHLSATADLHDELADALAHAAASDEVARAHRAGLPVALPTLEAAWLADEVAVCIAADHGIGAGPIAQWLAHRHPVVDPVVLREGADTAEDPHGRAVGVGIAPGVARIWATTGERDMELVRDGAVIATLACHAPVCRDARIRSGDALREPGSELLVRLPLG